MNPTNHPGIGIVGITWELNPYSWSLEHFQVDEFTERSTFSAAGRNRSRDVRIGVMMLTEGTYCEEETRNAGKDAAE